MRVIKGLVCKLMREVLGAVGGRDESSENHTATSFPPLHGHSEIGSPTIRVHDPEVQGRVSTVSELDQTGPKLGYEGWFGAC